MPTSAYYESSQGTTMSFNGVEFKATNIKTSRSREKKNVATLDQADGEIMQYAAAPLLEGDTISLTFFGKTAPDMSAKHTLVCSKFGISGPALCVKFDAEAKVGEYIMANAEFHMCQPDAA